MFHEQRHRNTCICTVGQGACAALQCKRCPAATSCQLVAVDAVGRQKACCVAGVAIIAIAIGQDVVLEEEELNLVDIMLGTLLGQGMCLAPRPGCT